MSHMTSTLVVLRAKKKFMLKDWDKLKEVKN
jgi:hypothetical protein